MSLSVLGVFYDVFDVVRFLSTILDDGIGGMWTQQGCCRVSDGVGSIGISDGIGS